MPETPVRVLLVDDDEDDYIITRGLIAGIRERRYQLDWVNCYDAGREAIHRCQHDIGLLDFRLGERTGLELLNETRHFPGRFPMILLTGQGDHAVDLAAMEAGAADYLLKGQLTSDILERAIRYAIEHQRAEERMRRDRDLFSRIMETSPVGIVMADRAGKITFANHRAEQVLGLSRDRATQGTGNVLDWRLTDLDGNPLADDPLPLKHVLESGCPVQDLRHAIQWNDQRRIPLSTNAAPLFDRDGRIDGMVITVQDIAERLNLEAQLRQSQKMESIGQLAAGVAHDINNVLTVIQGHAGLMLNVVPANGDFEKSLQQICAASERAARFVKQLLLFSRKQVIQSKVLDLNVVVRNLINMLPRMLGEDIALDIRYGESLPQIEADTGMIEQIVMNLAVNARDAMPRGGRLQISTSAVTFGGAREPRHPEARAGCFACLTVADNGCGMDRRVLQRIFEPFFSTKEPGKGTGLGLATVYGIVRQHHGWIEVQSEVRAGSTFKVFLPAAATPNRTAREIAQPAEAIRGGRETILLVEDETGLRDLVRNVLQQYHYRVLCASSGAEALRLWDEFEGRIDLLLTDMIMPGGMTGADLALQLKQRQPHLKVIYTSGYSSDLIGKDLAQEAIFFLPKPYLPPQLAEVVRKCLDASPTRTPPSAPAPQPA